MPNTTNYSFPTPADSDLVKNGADAIRDLGDAVDTAMNTALGTKKAMGVLLSTVSFSGVASVSLAADTFTSTYTNYKIIFQNISPANSLSVTMRLRASGSDNSSATYDSTILYGSASSALASSTNNGTSFAFSVGARQRTTIIADILNPKESKVTFLSSLVFETTDGSTQAASIVNGQFDNTTSFDSASFIASGVNLMTGEYSVYGYNK